jgi:hypothetical protein
MQLKLESKTDSIFLIGVRLVQWVYCEWTSLLTTGPSPLATGPAQWRMGQPIGEWTGPVASGPICRLSWNINLGSRFAPRVAGGSHTIIRSTPVHREAEVGTFRIASPPP